MTRGLEFVGLVALLFVGSAGWGGVGVGVLRRLGWHDVALTVTAPLQVALGMCLFLAVGGVLVAADAASVGVLFAWHAVGAAVALGRVPAAWRRRQGPRRVPWPSTVALAAAGVVVALVSVGTAVGSPRDNVRDDDPGYIYFAQRLLHTGGLVDPFNFRRLTSYGGSTLYQAMFLRVSGTASLYGFEFVFAALLLLVLVVGSLDRRWIAVGTVVVGVELFVGYAIGPVANLTANFSVAALSLGVFQLLRRVRASPAPDQPWLWVVIGLFMAGIVALRFYFVIPVVFVTLAMVWVFRRRGWWRPVVVLGGSGAVALAGWAVALWRSSGTPFFSLVPGNLDTSSPSGGDPLVHGVAPYLSIFRAAYVSDGVGAVATATAAVGLVLVVLGQRRLQEPLLLVFAGVGCLVELLALAYIFAGSDTPSRVRFEAPSTLACGLLVLDTLWPRRHRSATATAPPPRGVDWDALLTRLAPRWRQGRRRARLVGSVTVLAMVGMGVALFGTGPSSRLRSARTEIESGYHVLAGSAGFVNQYAGDEAEYRRLNAMIPAGARVLAAVDQPALLDFSRYSFATLDIPGFVSPPPHMPYFRGAAAKVAYLRRLGYDYIVTESPSALGLYYQPQWINELRLQGYFFRAWTPYFLDWQQSVDQLETSHRYALRSAGDLVLIRIADARAHRATSPA